ncbi:helix-turn-helix domain-containing protein [Sutcliffiella horikoshii]|uniref:helix-turn-helix domain-containing protein n=1 Tax=Sutcliffiella horikoshii TaxID=79883 RepID=UPI003CE69813
MRNYGKILKLRRKELKITQMELCEGICSHTYLSKVENEKVDPHPDTLKLILKRLGISEQQENILELSMRVKEDLDTINKQLFLEHNNPSKVRERLNSIVDVDRFRLEPKVQLLIRLTELRLFILESDHPAALNIIQHIEPIFSQLEDDNRFYYILYSGLYYVKAQNYERALNQLLKVDMQHSSYPGTPLWAKGYYYYLLSLCYSYRYNTSKSLYYVEKGLEIFKGQFIISRSVDCYILKGICEYRLKDYNNSIEDFAVCVEYLTEKRDIKRLAKVNHNLGLVYQAINESERALEYFEKAIEGKESINDRTESLTKLILIKVYFSLGEISKAKVLLDGVSNYSSSLAPEVELLGILINRKVPLVNVQKKINRHMKELISLEKWKEVKDFSIWFAEAFAKIYQYKKSNGFYQQAIYSYSKIS